MAHLEGQFSEIPLSPSPPQINKSSALSHTNSEDSLYREKGTRREVIRQYSELCSKFDKDVVCKRALEGKLADSCIRSVYWKIFLGLLPLNSAPKTWPSKMRLHRENYEELKEKYLVDPRRQDLDPTFNHPLALDSSSPWTKFFENKEIEQTIRQDVKRCFPNYDFFRDAHTQERMVRILLIWSRCHSKLSYRQGMDDLLGPILYVLWQDSDALSLDGTADDVTIDSVDASAVISSEHVEHDAYIMFDALMQLVAPFFAPAESTNSPSQIIKGCRNVQYVLLKEIDHLLHTRLESLGIEPQLYALRWIRLLVVREFHLQDVLRIWDALFSFDKTLSLINYLCVAMLLYVREFLLQNDHQACLKRLLNFPPVEDVFVLVERALEFTRPKPKPRTSILPSSPSSLSTSTSSPSPAPLPNGLLRHTSSSDGKGPPELSDKILALVDALQNAW
eukprot:CAMPEP_0184649718 /NCGR_PEP_ID=MMETSP0308-20130426/7123_1 /TAXON_ID=38269 /ORGANISM="Gloeochaete witrockiana, Strain SAG 46.84" /LENGTH=448 /DNA_ID=CAMNT_0027082649 /DNA_START=98 /DNA_END=1441 /DNA_ORIENTATION=+